MLLVAALIVWSLLIWIVGIAAVAAVVGRPGQAGRRARQLLGHIAPTAVRNVLLTVAGVSLLPGLTACGMPATDTRRSWTVGPSSLRGLHVPANSAEQLDIDWPATVPARRRTTSRPSSTSTGRQPASCIGRRHPGGQDSSPLPRSASTGRRVTRHERVRPGRCSRWRRGGPPRRLVVVDRRSSPTSRRRRRGDRADLAPVVRDERDRHRTRPESHPARADLAAADPRNR